MLDGMTETHRKSPSGQPQDADPYERDESGAPEDAALALPSHVAGSGALDRLVETARDYARQAVSENTLKAYAKDWTAFARWCRMRGADPLPASPQLIGLYIADLAAPGGKAPALSVSSIERRLSGLTWGYAQRGERMDRKDRHIASVLAGIRRKHARPPVQKEAILPEDLIDMLATLPHDLRGLRDRAILLTALLVACVGPKSSVSITARTTRPILAAGSRCWRTGSLSPCAARPAGGRLRLPAAHPIRPARSMPFRNGCTTPG